MTRFFSISSILIHFLTFDPAALRQAQGSGTQETCFCPLFAILHEMSKHLFHLILLFCFCQFSTGQSLSTSVLLSDWGFSDIQSIALAQFSVVHTQRGDRLSLRALYDAGTFADGRPSAGGRLDVADFREGSVNLLGGSYAAYGGSGGSAEVRHFLTSERTPAVDIRYDRRKGGYCGMWMHLYNSAAPLSARRYLDATAYGYLSVAIRGNQGNEKVVLKMADEAWNKKEDAFLVGDINRYISGSRIEKEWQTAVIPMNDISSRVDRKKLATLVFEAFSPAAGSFQLGPISFHREFPESLKVPVLETAVAQKPLQKGIWMWETQLLVQKRERDKFLALLKKENLDNVFLAIPHDSLSVRSGLTVDERTLGPLVRTLNAAGVKVHALIGDKDFILPEKRSFVRNTIRNIVEYNKLTPPADRFHAIHLDVEPYLFPGFASPRQSWFLDNYVEALAECSRIAHEADMLIGADIPFWFDSIDERTHLPIVASLGGVSKPVYRHVLDLMDNVALMDYRTMVGEENQIFLFAAQELEYADEIGKQVFVGIETAPLPNETIVTLTGPLRKGVPRPAGGRKYMLVIQKQNRLIAATATTGDHVSDFLTRNRTGEDELFYWPIERTRKVEGNSLSFASLGARRLRSAMLASQFALRKYRSFAGFAIHHYGSFVNLK